MTKAREKNERSAFSEIRLLNKLCQHVSIIDYGGFEVEMLDVHIHPDGVGSSLSIHEHSFVEIHVIKKGQGKISINNKTYHFQEGQFTVNTPGQVHYWQVTKRPLVMYVWWIKIPTITDINNERQRLFNNLLTASSIVYKLPKPHWDIYKNLIAELKIKKLCYDIMARDYLSQILIQFARAASNKRKPKSWVELGGIGDEQSHIIKIVNHVLKDNINSPVMLEDIARHTHTSRRNITRLYKKETGLSIGQKLNELRMFRAEELVRETDLPIKAVAYNCGIPDGRYFSRKFKSQFGCSPTEFREQMAPTKTGRTVLNEDQIL